MGDIDNVLIVWREILSQLKVWGKYCQLRGSLRGKCGLYPIIFKFGLFFIFKPVVLDFFLKKNLIFPSLFIIFALK
jgi:hypothetical protein